MKTNYKANVLLVIFIFLTTLNYAQNLNVLKEDRGFRMIKLGDEISNYNCFKKIGPATGLTSLTLAMGDKDQSKILQYDFIPNSDYPYYVIGEVEIYKIEVMTYKEEIYEITILLQPHRDILPLLKYRYGNYTEEDDFILPSYTWKTNNGIVCELLGYGSSSKEIQNYLIKYTDENMTHLMDLEGRRQQEIDQRKRDRKLREQAQSDF